ncbi:hypothetical protein HanXRQr2_Chr12g0530631 [Helianthus annuus]|uniref:Uncharacterized protein n=1 Tax=Helianthus annuus TaxID=4232 RepID=A0A9K3HEQ8_HELAN|nr:hypothetical protein HanXRQr2_Chr12g0530631 [Helianthus annuus]KAJ0861852.1 hypothetical protein HanPSC8_Chr12g0511321 [Helianthus annuus]
MASCQTVCWSWPATRAAKPKGAAYAGRDPVNSSSDPVNSSNNLFLVVCFNIFEIQNHQTQTWDLSTEL